ncbi:MAG: hypothetical protein EOP49_42085, partial [Sphingobacteriales bacterium]
MKSPLKMMLLAVLLAGGAQAQMFQHKYGFASSLGSHTRNGEVTSSTGPGHLIGGTHVTNTAAMLPDYGIYVLRTDIDGRLNTVNEFNRSYVLSHGVSGYQLRITKGMVVEFSDGSGYGAVGSNVTQSGFMQPYREQGIAYVRLDLQGNVMNVQGYSFGDNSGYMSMLMGIKESVSKPGDMFVTGMVYPPGDDTTMWVMRIDQAGTLAWGKTFNFNVGGEKPVDLAENPVQTNQLVVLGDYDNPSASFHRGFWMTLDENTGTLTGLWA